MKASEKKTRYPRSAIEWQLSSCWTIRFHLRFVFLCAHLPEELDNLNFLIFGSGLGIWEFPIVCFTLLISPINEILPLDSTEQYME
jgi:hypothetical protein